VSVRFILTLTINEFHNVKHVIKKYKSLDNVKYRHFYEKLRIVKGVPIFQVNKLQCVTLQSTGILI